MALKNIGFILCVVLLPLLCLGIYDKGYTAGQDAQKVVLQDAINIQRKNYDEKLKARVKQFEDNYHESLMNFRAYEKERADKAIARAKLEFEAGEQSNEIINRIPNVMRTNDCTNVSVDAYRVYRDTRRIVSDPRSNRATNATSDTDTIN